MYSRVKISRQVAELRPIGPFSKTFEPLSHIQDTSAF